MDVQTNDIEVTYLRFSDQTAVVTGATSGIGKSIALALGREGANLILVGRDPQKLAATQADLHAHVAGTVETCCIDFAAEDLAEGCEQLVHMAAADILILSAGVLITSNSFADAKLADIDLQYRVNLRAPIALVQALLPELRARQGQVVFINSSAAQQKSKPTVAGYTATKYGLTSVADALRDEVNPQGIRVLSVYPGKTATPMQEQIYAGQDREYRGSRLLQAADVAEAVLSALALPRTAEITDIMVRPFLKE